MLDLLEKDPWLIPYASAIKGRFDYAERKERELTFPTKGSLIDFASGHHYFGLHKDKSYWIFREWAPNATAIYFVCDSNHWMRDESYMMSRNEHGEWELYMPLNVLKHGDHFKLIIEWDGGVGERIPAWSNYVVQDPDTHLFSAVVWDPEVPYVQQSAHPTIGDKPLLIYEAHIGMATEEEKVGSYTEFKDNILPKVAEKGYNALQLMAIMEHPYYGSFGYQVSSFFAPSSRFGTPDELRALIDEAHRLGLVVIMDLVHSHAVKNEAEGIARFDGSYTQYFHDGARMMHPKWDSMCFNYGKNEVLHFLLSNCRYWIEEFGFDGYRFDGVTSMLYLGHGMGQSFCTYNDYYNATQDGDAIMYLTLANKMIHEYYPDAITIAEEVSGMPGMAIPVKAGGYGFDYRLAMNIPDFWIKSIKEYEDENWKPGSIWWELTNRRNEEKCISYAESHDQALVGDKTIIFRLIDQEMYWHMDRASQSAVVDRGIALHKMIRLATLTTMNGGYLNFMGNEFGHPEWIDFPRPENGWSYKYARRQWSLADNGFLKYSYLQDFDHKMLEHVLSIPDYRDTPAQEFWSQNDHQVLAYGRGEYLYVYNFNPTESFVDYKILVPAGKYGIVLDTDDKDFGGFGRLDHSVEHFTCHDPAFTEDRKGWLSLYIPARTAMVLRKI